MPRGWATVGPPSVTDVEETQNLDTLSTDGSAAPLTGRPAASSTLSTPLLITLWRGPVA